MTDPISATYPDPTVAVAVEAVKATVSSAKDLGLTWQLRPATVTVDSPNESKIQAVLDGDTVSLTMVSLIGPRWLGDRVMVMIVPPSGLFVIGALFYDGWHIVGDDGQTEFETGWGNVGAPFADVAYTRTPDNHIELAGLASPTGTFTAPAIIFILPFGYRPTHTRVFPRSNNPSSGTAPTGRTVLINSDGEVSVTNFTAATNPGVVSLDGIYFARDTDSP